MATASSYWCYRCNRFVRVWPHDAIVCPDCDGGFLEEVETPPRFGAAAGEPRRLRFTVARPYHQRSDLRFRRHRGTSAADRSPFNPVIVLRGPADGGGGDADRAPASSFELYYDDGAGSGLRPLPESMSDFLMSSGFERLLDQLSQMDIHGIGGGRAWEQPPASKAAVESMPTVEIAASHIKMDTHCAVCTESFELGTEAREMPCKHIYHQDCILPWLSLRNSCPVCRHEMPTDVRGRSGAETDGEDLVGLTIWRLPGGGFAVGRFSGGRRTGERELPVVYTEVDGGFNSSGAARRISLASTRSRSRESGGIGRAFRNFISFFRRFRSSSFTSSRSTSDSGSAASPRHRRSLVFSRSSRRHSSSWALEDGNIRAITRW
ncbi:E3 ubiquitin-protein ligase RDUF1-like isoform X2 [Phoenix dactylifera]|uniref:RING-type E3 ubiquitin transferase n=1 Tax=Phoenix dactylifera TaxID=42345 RepID=A0A8B9AYV8_PHODC|nr:E3 ubiquitin-protein ligase RDUF1-like isoform X2 [Phoenix dactylifera]